MTALSSIAPPPLRLGDGRPAMSGWTLDESMLHLNHGSYGAVPRVTQQEQQRLRDEMERAPVQWFADLPNAVGRARIDVARFLGSSVDDLAFVPNASAGATAVFSSLPHTPGGEIVVTDHGYGAIVMGAERLARRWGGRVRVAHVPLAASAAEAAAAVIHQINARTALVVIDQVTSPTARRMPVAEISRAAREFGAIVLVDAAHEPGLNPEPAAATDFDYWVGNLHKFVCAPRGAAAIVARGVHREHLHPLIDSWGARLPFPENFDHQGTMDATSYLSASTSIEFIESTWGWSGVREYVGDLAAYAGDLIAASFTARTGEDHTVDVGMPVDSMRLVRLPAPLASDPAAAHRLRDRLLAETSVEAALTDFQGVGYLRLTPHVYNTAEHYEEFVDRVVPRVFEWAASGV